MKYRKIYLPAFTAFIVLKIQGRGDLDPVNYGEALGAASLGRWNGISYHWR